MGMYCGCWVIPMSIGCTYEGVSIGLCIGWVAIWACSDKYDMECLVEAKIRDI